MNIDEYRAMKAQEETEQQNPTPQGGEPNAQTEQTTNGSNPSEQEVVEQTTQVGASETDANQNSEANEQTQTTPEVIEIDGKQVTIDELKSGYLRQSDYTKKTQEIRRKEQEAEQAMQLIQQLQQNPQVAQELSQQFQLPNLDPAQAHVSELENKYFDLLIQSELRDLHDKYGDFNEQEVLETASNEGLNNLDTAYHVMIARKGGESRSEPTMNIDEIKQQLRDELLQELRAEQSAQVDTSTIINSGGGAPTTTNEPVLSAQETKVARMMGLGAKEYAKWRDAKKR